MPDINITEHFVTDIPSSMSNQQNYYSENGPHQPLRGSSTNHLIQPSSVPTYAVFTGNYVRLQKLEMQHIEYLYNLTHGSDEKESVWQHLPYGPFKSATSMQEHFQKYIDAPDELVFCVLDKKSNMPIGIVCLIECNSKMGTAEIASVTYPVSHQKTEANTEAVYLLMNYCVDKLNFRKIVWKCDNKNVNSKNSALRLGFEFEGLFYNHMVVKNRNRDTAWFGIIDNKWRMLSLNYERWLHEPDPTKRISLREMNGKVEKYSRVTYTA